MNIGVRAHDFKKQPPEGLADDIREFGFTGIQLALGKALSNFDMGTQGLSPGYGNYIRNVFRKRNIDISILGCYINPIHPDRKIREISLRRFEEHLRFARDFGCAIVATETGSVNPDCSYSPETEKESALLDLISVVKRLADTAERYGAIVGIEGVAHRHTVNTHERMVKLLEMVDSPNVQVVYDPVNFFPFDRLGDHEKHIEEAFELFGDRIVAIHAKDFAIVDGKKDGNLPSGRGEMNYEFFFKLLEEKKPGIHILLENNTPETMKKTVDFVRSVERKVTK
jgi:sugar phosphate isomerase/epimerase